VFIIDRPRIELHKRISDRTEQMIEKGLLAEVRMILDKGYDRNIQALQTVGYREAISFIDGELPNDQMVKDIKTATRRYAKRQITWFRRWPFIHQLNAGESTEEQLLNQVLQKVAANRQNR
jgi:tRNA dimethylallyltransferase